MGDPIPLNLENTTRQDPSLQVERSLAVRLHLARRVQCHDVLSVLSAFLPVSRPSSLMGYGVNDRLVSLDRVQHREREASQEEATDVAVVTGADLRMLSHQVPGLLQLFDEVEAETALLVVVIANDRTDLVLCR